MRVTYDFLTKNTLKCSLLVSRESLGSDKFLNNLLHSVSVQVKDLVDYQLEVEAMAVNILITL